MAHAAGGQFAGKGAVAVGETAHGGALLEHFL